MKKEIDPGLQYLKDIGFKRIRGKYGLYDRWVELYGKEKTMELFNIREKLGDGTLEFYEFKNSDPVLSQSISEAYDSEIIRSACNYIVENKDYFGKTILEVGCESGYMTGFLAKTFPDSKIISIDRSTAAASITKQRLKSMNISNVDVINCSLDEIEEKFDTVFCMRTIQENIDHSKAPFEGEMFMYQCCKYSELCENYTDLLISHIKDDGNLVVFERVNHDPLMCGWLLQLNNCNFGISYETYKEFKCEEAGDLSTFQAFICQKGNHGETQEIFDLWSESVGVDPTGKKELKGWDALVYLNDNAGELIRGIRVFDGDESKQNGRFAIFADCDDKNLLYYLNAPGGDEVTLLAGNVSHKDEMLSMLESTIKNNSQFIIKEISQGDDHIENN